MDDTIASLIKLSQRVESSESARVAAQTTDRDENENEDSNRLNG